MPKQSHALFGFWKKFQVATSHVHHIEDKNDSLESKNQAAKNNKDVKTQKKAQNIETWLGGFKIFQNYFLQKDRNTRTKGEE